jgi:hypothetical protein
LHQNLSETVTPTSPAKREVAEERVEQVEREVVDQKEKSVKKAKAKIVVDEEEEEEAPAKPVVRRGRPKKQKEEPEAESKFLPNIIYRIGTPKRRSSSRSRKSTSLYSPTGGKMVNTEEALGPKRGKSATRRKSIGSRKTNDSDSDN